MKRADEMEMYISLKSTRLAWVFTVVFLLIWTWYEYTQGRYLGMPFILLSGQILVFWTSQIIFRKIMAGKDEKQD